MGTNEMIKRERNLELLKTHNILFNKWVNRKDCDLNLKCGVKLYYESFLTINNVMEYYSMPMNYFFNIMCKSVKEADNV